MKHAFNIRRMFATVAFAAAALLAGPQALAQLADLADAPLANSPSTSVLPNLMYILDDSGSMAWNYMPDYVQRTSQGDLYANCRVCTSSSCNGPGATSSSLGAACGNSNASASVKETGNSTPIYGEAPFYANAFNKIWYNPDITYAPAVNSTGASFGNMSATSAKADAYLDNTTTNLTSQFQEVIYCSVSNPNVLAQADTTKCRFNGRHNVTPFSGTTNYFLNGASTGANAGFPTTAFYNKVLVTNSNAHFYNITANEYCSDQSLTTCQLATAAGAAPVGFSIAAPIRWCKSAADAILTTVVSGNSSGTARCRKKFDKTSGYVYPRYGRFQRVDIIPAVATYPKSASALRTDCLGATSCSYAEELQNFANWWSFYRTRLALMKTSTGRAFLSIDDRFKVGFITINPNNPVTSDKFVPVSKFVPAQRSSFYTTLYSQATNGSTPLREALSRVGRYYAGVTGGINSGMTGTAATPDPVEYSCQTNYALLTTDGYWNGSAGQNLAGGGIGNQDNVDAAFTTRAVGAYDGALGGSIDTLADVAAFYYKTDLRTTGVVAPNNVPTNARDTATHQHMVTFSLGLGLEGFMDYISNYDSAATGDFAKIKSGSNNACAWTSGTCNWPTPVANEPSALDDLWHAAVNGRGTYFSASDPNSLSQGLQSALAQLRVATAAAAASATSSPNITQTDNFIYSSTFRTAKWDGEVVAQRIDTTTGNVLAANVWTAQDQLDTKAAANARTIYTIDETGGGKRKVFSFATLSLVAGGNGIAAEQAYFTNKCGALSQCAVLTLAQQAIANSGDNMINYLRGDRTFESFTAPETAAPFRQRDHVLGDPVNATPAFVKAPSFGFTDPGYGAYKLTYASRQAMLYIAANDGMLHALNGLTGDEMWAYVPRIVMPKLAKIATANWSATHVFSVDGSPQVMDVFINGGWKTILVAGLNSGGRGYYALDVTTPATPVVLWEFCSDSTLCVLNDPDVGFTYGNPLITERKDGKWVVYVTSGMNNVSPGSGQGILWTLDAATGAVIDKVNTGAGTAIAPSGFNHIAGFADEFDITNYARLIYGGDLDGNLWRFDTSSGVPVVSKLAVLKDGGGKVQPVTSRPELALINGFPIVYVGTGRYLGIKDLSDPATLGLPYAYQQSLYAIKDKGTSYGNFRLGNVVVNTLIDNVTTRTTSQNPVDWALKDGWYIDFNPGNTSPGERVNLDPQLVQGTLVVVTNVPNNSACTVGGDSFIYQFDYKSGIFVKSSAGNVAGQKFTGQITVGVVIVRLPSGVFKGIATGASGTKTPFAVNIGGGGGAARRISWRELIQK